MSESEKFSAYILCYNNSDTIRTAIEGVSDQSETIDEIIVVDDGSSDKSVEAINSTGSILICHEANKGRGAARLEAMNRASNDIVLCCDATNSLEKDFLKKALKWFYDPQIAAVYGKLQDASPRTSACRWRARHLFNQDMAETHRQTDSLITWGTILRKSAHDEVGGFNSTMTHSEDFDLGQRLTKNGFKIIYDPELAVYTQVINSPSKAIERYLRWNFGPHEKPSLGSRIKFCLYALRVLFIKDLRCRDLPASFITLRCMFASLFYNPKRGK